MSEDYNFSKKVKTYLKKTILLAHKYRIFLNSFLIKNEI